MQIHYVSYYVIEQLLIRSCGGVLWGAGGAPRDGFRAASTPVGPSGETVRREACLTMFFASHMFMQILYVSDYVIEQLLVQSCGGVLWGAGAAPRDGFRAASTPAGPSGDTVRREACLNE